MTGPWDKQGPLSVLIPPRKAVRGRDALLAQSHVHLMEFLQLVTQAQGWKGVKKKSERAGVNEEKGAKMGE